MYFDIVSFCLMNKSRSFNAPEILLGLKRVSYSADMWSFAVTWLRLLGVTIDKEVRVRSLIYPEYYGNQYVSVNLLVLG